MDNLEPTTVDNPQTQTDVLPGGADPQVDPQVDPVSEQNWKNSLRSDLRDSPFAQKFGEDVDGLNKFVESYGNLEKLLGHDKVPIPKGADDLEGWNRFSKAMGIPDKSDGYSFQDPALPDTMKGMTIDKEKFAEVVHAHKLTPGQAEGLWNAYNEININTYQNAVQNNQKQIQDMISTLKGEWGDAYDTNVELGQMVINKFSDDQETNDFITSVLAQDPRGVKFLARVGDQFAENKIGEFRMKRFSLAPEEASAEIDKILHDPNHPYNNEKATDREHQAAIDQVNALYKAANRTRG